jgi:hypothetical protein
VGDGGDRTTSSHVHQHTVFQPSPPGGRSKTAEETDLATWDVVSVASDIAGAGTPLAGLILVYLGAVAVRYETLDYKAQASARDVYRRHARRAFRGVVLALGAVVAALIAKSLKSEPYAAIIATMAGLALLASFFIAVMAAYWILTSLD